MGDQSKRPLEMPRLVVGLILLAAVVASWFYFSSKIDCPNAAGYCDGDDRRGPGLAMFYVTMLLGPLGFAAVLSAFPRRTTPPIGRNWLLWIVALFSTVASTLLNLTIAFVFVGAGLFGSGSVSALAWGVGALSLAGGAANGFAAALILQLLLPHRLRGRVLQQTAPALGENRVYFRFAVGAGSTLLIATLLAGGFGFFAALLLIGVAFLLLPRAGGRRAR